MLKGWSREERKDYYHLTLSLGCLVRDWMAWTQTLLDYLNHEIDKNTSQLSVLIEGTTLLFRPTLHPVCCAYTVYWNRGLAMPEHLASRGVATPKRLASISWPEKTIPSDINHMIKITDGSLPFLQSVNIIRNQMIGQNEVTIYIPQWNPVSLLSLRRDFKNEWTWPSCNASLSHISHPTGITYKIPWS